MTMSPAYGDVGVFTVRSIDELPTTTTSAMPLLRMSVTRSGVIPGFFFVQPNLFSSIPDLVPTRVSFS
jgi:hypothetical protein